MANLQYDDAKTWDSYHISPQWLSDSIELSRGRNMVTVPVFAALANDRRLQILEWLKDPRAHFPPQVDGDLIKDGVCAVLIAQKLGVSQPTVSEHLKVLSQAGLIRGKRIKQWTFYKREESRIREVKKAILAKI